jgi:hypothetical protein
MSIVFSAPHAGIAEQARSLAGVDSVQWPNQKIANSANNWHDFVTGYAIGADKRFQWDDTNHTKLPEGTADLTAGVSDYSFQTDEQGNQIISLTGISILRDGSYTPLTSIDRNDLYYYPSTYGMSTGLPTQYDKIADNIIRLNFKPEATVPGGLKFYFQRTGSYFTATDTTKTPGVSPLLHRGYVIACAFDIALTLALANLQALSTEREKEERKVISYFNIRNRDERSIMTGARISFL